MNFDAFSNNPVSGGLVPGTVYLVGAGPGDPELITLRGARCLARADVVLHDRLLHPDILDLAPRAERIDVGKAAGRPGVGQDGIHRLLVREARRGRVVVRLKGGDPFVFGRGGEEIAALNAAGVPCEVVPGLSSAGSAPGSVGIPLTHRGVARAFAVVTAHQAPDCDGGPDWAALARIDTLVVLMGVGRLARICGDLRRHGRAASTPAALIERGTLPGERLLVATLGDLPDRAEAAAFRPPSILVVGEVVRVREELAATAGALLPEQPLHEPILPRTTLQSPAATRPFLQPPILQKPFSTEHSPGRRTSADGLSTPLEIHHV